MKFATEFTHLPTSVAEQRSTHDHDSLNATLKEFREAIKKLVLVVDGLPREQQAGICRDRLYTPEETAELLAIRSRRATQTISSIDSLPRVRVGPNGGLVRYLGDDILSHIESRREV